MEFILKYCFNQFFIQLTCSYLLNIKFYVFTVPPKVLATNEGNINVNPKYPDPFTMSCDAVGKPNVSIVWKRDGEVIDDSFFHPPDSTPVEISDHYGLIEGIRSTVSWNPPLGANCDNIHFYDGTYACFANNDGFDGNRESSSQGIHWETHCETFCIILLFLNPKPHSAM